MTTAEAETWKPGTWNPIRGFGGYEAWDRGAIRSTDRIVKGRRYKSVVLATRISNRSYELVNVRDDDGNVRTCTVHTLMMLAFEEEPCPPGMEVRHWNDDPLDNRWAPGGEAGCRAGLGNLVYGTPKQNAADKLRNRPQSQPVTRLRWSRRVTAAVRHAASRLRRRRCDWCDSRGQSCTRESAST